MKNFSSRLAVCSWSLQPKSPEELLQKLSATGERHLQLALDPLREDPAVWTALPERLQAAGVSIVSGMFGCVGEDYTTMETIRATGGIAPDETWTENWENIQETAEIADRLGLKLVTFHAGFLPHDPADPEYAKLFHRLTLVADLFAAKGIDLGLETGQETAPDLLALLERLQRKNVGVNFDPANMILYDKGDPIEALRTLGGWLKQVHIKDARKTREPGTWGEEVPAGTGEVQWPAFFRILNEIDYQGWCCIEREAGNQRVEDIALVRDLILSSYGKGVQP